MNNKKLEFNEKLFPFQKEWVEKLERDVLSQEIFVKDKRETLIKIVTVVISGITIYFSLIPFIYKLLIEKEALEINKYIFIFLTVLIIVSILFSLFFMYKFFKEFYPIFSSKQSYVAGKEKIFPNPDDPDPRIKNLNNVDRYKKWMIEHRLLYAEDFCKTLNELSKSFDNAIKSGINLIKVFLVTALLVLILFLSSFSVGIFMSKKETSTPKNIIPNTAPSTQTKQPQASLQGSIIMTRRNDSITFDQANLSNSKKEIKKTIQNTDKSKK